MRNSKVWILIMTVVFGIVWYNEKFKEGEPPAAASDRSARPSQGVSDQTHYFYIPTSTVLDNGQFVLGFSELAMGIDRNLQLFMCPVYSIAGIFLGVKYGPSNDFAFGGGIAPGWHNAGLFYLNHNRYRLYTYDHGFGIGGFVTKAVSNANHLAANIRIWDGALLLDMGIGGEKGIGDFTKFMYEAHGGVGSFTGVRSEINIGGVLGIRYSFPAMPELKLTAGAALDALIAPESNLDIWPYIDILYSGRF